MEKKRYDGLDLMKAIAILMVISLHIPLWHNYYFLSGDDMDCK